MRHGLIIIGIQSRSVTSHKSGQGFGFHDGYDTKATRADWMVNRYGNLRAFVLTELQPELSISCADSLVECVEVQLVR